jgi:hypothetical protein
MLWPNPGAEYHHGIILMRIIQAESLSSHDQKQVAGSLWFTTESFACAEWLLRAFVVAIAFILNLGRFTLQIIPNHTKQ